ncbi:MAG: histidine phosphatase family protein, partial [bacterium]
MSTLHFIRHGQAGTRDAYDALSETGCAQSRLLGEFLAGQRIVFTAAFAGGMRRQQETAKEVRRVYLDRALAFPDIVTDSDWNEFDLDGVYNAIAPQLAESDPEFRRGYDEMRTAMAAGRGDPEASIHRRWTACDIAVVRAWVDGRYAYNGETWDAFRQRIGGHPEKFTAFSRDANVAIFTSATPAAIWAALSLDIADVRVLELAGVLYNASVTTLRYRQGQIRLFGFNAIS